MEDAYVIKGGTPLKGSVTLSGAKNVALKVIISALMFDNEVTIHNIPRINDVLELLHLIKLMGGRAEFIDTNSVVIDGKEMKENKVDLLHGSKIRVSFMFFAPLLHKFKSCFVPNPGGCRIGARPIDRIIEGMKSLGLEIDYDSDTGYYNARINKPVAGGYTFLKPSHTGTELLILVSLLGKDPIIIENAALEPEIDELIRFLNESGGHIRREGTKIVVEPAAKLHQLKPFMILSDRNEAITFATLAFATKGDIRIGSIPVNLIDSFTKKVSAAGGGYERIGEDMYRFYYKGPLTATDIETEPHPGFMTDWQPNWAVLMTQAEGESIIRERVFENRFSYVKELHKLGADIVYLDEQVKDAESYYYFNYFSQNHVHQAIRIKGPQQFHGGVVTVADLRAGATLVIAAFVASDESIVNGVSIIERGYENFVQKNSALGGDIRIL